MGVTLEQKQILVAGIEGFLSVPGGSKAILDSAPGYVLLRRVNGAGIESANLYTVKDGQPDRLIVFQEFREGSVTIADKDPEWKQHLMEWV